MPPALAYNAKAIIVGLIPIIIVAWRRRTGPRKENQLIQGRLLQSRDHSIPRPAGDLSLI